MRVRRSGFTLLELLIVLTILAVLIALIVVGVQRVRESANRAVCANNIAQIGFGFKQHESFLGVFPDGGGHWTEGRAMCSDGSPAVTPNQTWGWAYQLLPYIGQQNLWAVSDSNKVAQTVVEMYFCPSRRLPCTVYSITSGLPDGPRGAIDYAGNGGNSTPVYPADNAYLFAPGPMKKNGTVVPRTNIVHINSPNIPDGLSSTILVGEREVNRKWLGNGQGYDENNGYIDGWDWDTIRWSHNVPVPDRFDDYPYSLQFGSAHIAGVNFLFADGTVRLIGYDVSLSTFQQLSDRDDGKVLDPTSY
jgi:prepilin-type N-terminal cleavage/methylation domain-containing protein